MMPILPASLGAKPSAKAPRNVTSGGPQQETLGVGDQRTEVGHGADADEDQTGIDAELDTQIEVVEQAGIRHEDVPMHMSALEERRVVEVRIGQVREQHTERDGQQQQRLELMLDGQIEQQERHADHRHIAPPHRGEETGDARRTGEIPQAVPDETGTGIQQCPHSATRSRLSYRPP